MSGNPILLNSTVKQDPEILQEINFWKPGIENVTMEEIGKTKVFLDGNCRFGECNLGNLLTDAFIYYVRF